jgi:phosphoglucosamine mutase
VGADLGLVVSASHNLARDNGIKFFTSSGLKLPRSQEKVMERALREGDGIHLAPADSVGKVEELDRGEGESLYLEILKEELSSSGLSGEKPLAGLRVKLDCAHGATWRVAPRLLDELGAEVVPLNVSPTGSNINRNCGSTQMEFLQKKVKQGEIGLAYDGDGDRVLFVDEEGELVDGDAVLFLAASCYQERGLLQPPLVVATTMSNFGLEKALEEKGIELLRTKVGDRFVAQKMKEKGALIGGEQSGHLIFSEISDTGDGLVTAAKVLGMVKERGERLADLADGFRKYPQFLENVKTENKERLSLDDALAESVRDWEERLGERGRVLIRPSGTQDVVRVMVEATAEDLARQAAKDLAQAVDRQLNGNGKTVDG